MTTKNRVVLVAGQRFAAPEGADNETIRQTLLAAGFADVANATIKTRTEEDGAVEVIEFVKQGGTKGLSGAEFAELLAAVPRQPLVRQVAEVPPEKRNLVRHFVAGHLSNEEAVAQVGDILEWLYKFVGTEHYTGMSMGGGNLCARISALPAVAVEGDGCAW